MVSQRLVFRDRDRRRVAQRDTRVWAKRSETDAKDASLVQGFQFIDQGCS
jgi:hypothetical protein